MLKNVKNRVKNVFNVRPMECRIQEWSLVSPNIFVGLGDNASAQETLLKWIANYSVNSVILGQIFVNQNLL
jgi:hypothetical protein